METMIHSSMAEESVIGCILVDAQTVLPTIRGIVQPGDFVEANARAIFRAAVELDDNRLPIDPVTIQQKAAEMGFPVSTEWIRETMHLTVTTANVAADAEVIHKAAVGREARNVGDDLTEGKITPEEALERLQGVLTGGRSTLPTPVEDATEFYQYISDAAEGKTAPFLPTGFAALDDLLGGGLIKSGLITLAARPSMGKTAVGLAIASNVAKAGGRVLYISLEMSRPQLMARRLASRTGISFTRLLNGSIQKDDIQTWQTVGRGLTELSAEQLIISDNPCRVGDIELKARASMPLDLIVVDHMGIVTADRGEESNFYVSSTNRCKRLQQLAKSTGTPVLMLCQLNRAVESRDNKRPKMADLRDTGAVEECSDAVLLLYRDGYYQENKPQPWEHQIIEVDVAKNRHGQTGTASLDFVGMLTLVRGIGEGLHEVDTPTPFDKGETA